MQNKNNKEPPWAPSLKRVVNVILGGKEVNGVTYTSLKNLSKISINREKRTRYTLIREEITFSNKDADRLIMPQDNGLVITLRIDNTDVRHVLVDPGSSANTSKYEWLRRCSLWIKLSQKHYYSLDSTTLVR